MGDSQVVEERGNTHGEQILARQLRNNGHKAYLANRCLPARSPLIYILISN